MKSKQRTHGGKEVGSKRLKTQNKPPRTLDSFFEQREQDQDTWNTALRVISKMRSDGLSLNKASKEAGISPSTVKRLAGRAIKKQPNGRYAVARRDSLLRVVRVPTTNGSQDVAVRNSRDASILGQYWEAVQKYYRTGDSSGIDKFRGTRIKDKNGVDFPLITDLKELKRLGSAGSLSFESLYSKSA